MKVLLSFSTLWCIYLLVGDHFHSSEALQKSRIIKRFRNLVPFLFSLKDKQKIVFVPIPIPIKYDEYKQSLNLNKLHFIPDHIPNNLYETNYGWISQAELSGLPSFNLENNKVQKNKNSFTSSTYGNENSASFTPYDVQTSNLNDQITYKNTFSYNNQENNQLQQHQQLNSQVPILKEKYENDVLSSISNVNRYNYDLGQFNRFDSFSSNSNNNYGNDYINKNIQPNYEKQFKLNEFDKFSLSKNCHSQSKTYSNSETDSDLPRIINTDYKEKTNLKDNNSLIQISRNEQSNSSIENQQNNNYSSLPAYLFNFSGNQKQGTYVEDNIKDEFDVQKEEKFNNKLKN